MSGKILSDHVKKKKVFVTPANDKLSNLSDANYAKDVVPNILWISMLCESLGLKRTVGIVEKLTDGFLEIKDSKGTSNCCLISSYYELDDEKRQRFLNHQSVKLALTDIRNVLSGFKEYYPEAPINFMLTDCQVNKDQFFETLRNNLKRLFDRRSTQSILALSCVFYAFVCARCIGGNIPPDFDLNKVVDYPNTDDSLSTGRFVATSVKACLHLMDEDVQQKWVQYFWKRSYELDPCKIIHLTDIEP